MMGLIKTSKVKPSLGKKPSEEKEYPLLNESFTIKSERNFLQ
jgi:hypothetical protein